VVWQQLGGWASSVSWFSGLAEVQLLVSLRTLCDANTL
jgi:hypothetical protein